MLDSTKCSCSKSGSTFVGWPIFRKVYPILIG